MNKKVIISIIAVILLVAVLTTVLVACNKEDYQKRLEKKGYKVSSLTDLGEAFGVQSTKVEWSLEAAKDDEYVEITKYKNSDDANKAYEDAKKTIDDLGEDGKNYKAKKVGKIVIFGTKQGVKDAG